MMTTRFYAYRILLYRIRRVTPPVTVEDRTKSHQASCSLCVTQVAKLMNLISMTFVQEHCLVLCLGDGAFRVRR